MKLGVIVECPLQGVDHQVYQYVIPKLNGGISFEVVSAGRNKIEMVVNCGAVASALIESGCDRVLIVWDLMPRFGGAVCRKLDVDAIVESLSEHSVPVEKVKLVCIEPELEAWFLVDGAVLTSYKEELWHPHTVKKFSGIVLPSNSRDAKTTISKYLERKYSDYEAASRIVKHIEHFDRIANNHESFGRLKSFIESL